MASDGNKKQAIRWAVYPDGLHIFSEGRAVGVIPFDEANHLIAELSNSVVGYTARDHKKDLRNRVKFDSRKVIIILMFYLKVC